MMIKVGNDFLDFNDDIDIERQIKLFEKISTTDGDFSYQFDVQATVNNLSILGIPFPDNASKIVYQKIDCQITNDSGLKLYDGFIRVEVVTDKTISCSFFSGNNNWFSLLTGNMIDIDWSDFDIDQTLANIDAAIGSTGVTFPIVDAGALLTRSYHQMKIEDFVAGIYVKTVFNRIFQKHSIKLEGELINDPTYNSLITIRDGHSQEQIDANTCFVQKTATTARPIENDVYKVTFQNDSVDPYFDGANNNWDLANSKYVAPVKMTVVVEIILKASIIDASYNNRIQLFINGVFTFVDIGLSAGGLYNSATPGDKDFFTLLRTITLNQNDQLEVYAQWQQSGGSTQNDVLSGTIRITPGYIFKVFGKAVVPNWTQQQYVSNILRLFNVIPAFNNVTKTLTLNFFERIKDKTELDISGYVSEFSTDFKYFISNYGKKSTFGYKEITDDAFKLYNIQNYFKYGQGVIDIANDFIPNTKPIIESDFSNPIGYINTVFDMSMERLNLIDLEGGDSVGATAVTASGTNARFAIPKDIFLDSDLVRIIDSTNPLYNGDWIIETQAAGYIEMKGLLFDTNATATITKMTFKYKNVNDVYLLWNIPYYPVANFTSKASIVVEDTDFIRPTVAYFNLLNTGRQINTDFIQSLSFGDIQNDLFYQRTLLQTYWGLFGRILNDPVKLFCKAVLPYLFFLKLDFLQPVRLKSVRTSNLYYVNRITSYKSSSKKCTVELIKLP